MQFDWAEIPQLNFPRENCTCLVSNNKLFVLFGQGPLDSPSGRKQDNIGPINQIEYADLDDLMAFKSDAKKEKMDSGQTVRNPFKVMGIEGCQSNF